MTSFVTKVNVLFFNLPTLCAAILNSRSDLRALSSVEQINLEGTVLWGAICIVHPENQSWKSKSGFLKFTFLDLHLFVFVRVNMSARATVFFLGRTFGTVRPIFPTPSFHCWKMTQNYGGERQKDPGDVSGINPKMPVTRVAVLQATFWLNNFASEKRGMRCS
jgi:hypothetical protein